LIGIGALLLVVVVVLDAVVSVVDSVVVAAVADTAWFVSVLANEVGNTSIGDTAADSVCTCCIRLAWLLRRCQIEMRFLLARRLLLVVVLAVAVVAVACSGVTGELLSSIGN
jgi:hypothetical protein